VRAGGSGTSPTPPRRLRLRGPSCQAPPPLPPPESLQELLPLLLPSLPLLLRLLPAPSMIPILEARGWWWNEDDDEEATTEAEEVEEEKEGEEEVEVEEGAAPAPPAFPPPPFSFSISLVPSRAAIPKSASLTTPEALISTLAALTSRWTTPFFFVGKKKEERKKEVSFFFVVVVSLAFSLLSLLSHLRVQVAQRREHLCHDRRRQGLR
jgi:hypothetical protein